MIRCTVCCRPDTLPGVVFNDKGVCPACVRYAMRESINWERRGDFLKNLCNEHRSQNGAYDCIIPVSGGKDSFYQVHIMKNEYNMHPLLVSVADPFTGTPEGRHNHETIARAFGCDTVSLRLDPLRVAKSSLMTLERSGCTNWEVDRAIYAWPLQMAIRTGIKLVVYGENVSWEYGGPNAEDTFDANDQIRNNVVPEDAVNFVEGADRNALRHPSYDEINEARIQSIYLSWFFPWNDFVNLRTAEHHGFKKLSTYERVGYLDDYAQIDSIGYLFNYYLKFMKYGIGRVVDIGSRWVRYGHFSRERLQEAIDTDEGRFDLFIAADYCRAVGKDWHDVKPLVSKWWNRDIFDVAEGSMEWRWKK